MATIESKQSFWYTYIIIEVALSIHHIIFLRQYGCNKFLGCSLAVCACDTYYRNVELTTMLACHLFECSQYIVDYDKSFVTLYGILLLVNDCIRATLVESCLSKLITVERFAF